MICGLRVVNRRCGRWAQMRDFGVGWVWVKWGWRGWAEMRDLRSECGEPQMLEMGGDA